MYKNRVELPGSAKTLPAGCEKVGEVDEGAAVTVTVILRRIGQQPAVLNGTPPFVTRADFRQKLGADPADIRAVEDFAHAHHLSVVDASAEKRRVIVRGKLRNLMEAFGAELAHYTAPNAQTTFRGREGTLSIPEELQNSVLAVLGLDNRQAAFAHFIVSPRATTSSSYSTPQIATLYDFPAGLTGKGQTVAIIELGGGYKTADLQQYFNGLGIKAPSVTAVSVDGGMNTPGTDADGEVDLDIEIVGAVAPEANIAVYFAPNTDQGFVDAITDAVHDSARKPSIISISWGAPEDSWTDQARTAMNAALQDAATLGVTVTAAAGDNGSSDGAGDSQLHVDFPAASPYALACGGTTLKGSGRTISSETVWNEVAQQEGATGGGISTTFPLPTYQQNAGVPLQPTKKYAGRGVPDVAGNADPATGYQIVIDGKTQIIGGTSAVAPLWAGLLALFNEKLGAPVGFLQPAIYRLAQSAFRDIQSGNNDDSNLGYYGAQTGWDPCCGLGSPNGTALLSALEANQQGSATAT